jgi:hypothetical protein
MESGTRTLIALALVPFAVFGLRLFARTLVELAYQYAPEGRFKRLLSRDRAKRR